MKRALRKVFMRARAKVLSATSDQIGGIVATADTVHGWIAGPAARELALASYALPQDATIVEVGVFMGRSTILLAGPRRLTGSGIVHSIDPFDGSGDAHSVPHYISELSMAKVTSIEDAFRRNLTRTKLDQWVQIHKGTSRMVSANWNKPIDLLLLDGDHSPEGAREAFESWYPHLKPGGLLVLSNTGERTYSPGHDGNRRVSLTEVIPPRFHNVRQVDYFMFAEKA
jgi:hypothetical protein